LLHYLTAFKDVRMVFLGKLGKRDFSWAESFRPISVLPVLGKGLERIVARALSCRVLATGLVNTQQVGAVLRRLAVDLVAGLLHDCEAARYKDRYGALVTMDVRGGFNVVQHNRLVNRLRSQGWGE